jgi:hypothetical protein
MLQGASEEHITGRTRTSYWLSEFKSSVVSAEEPKDQNIHQKAKQMKMLSKGTCIQKLKYYYLSSS